MLFSRRDRGGLSRCAPQGESDEYQNREDDPHGEAPGCLQKPGGTVRKDLLSEDVRLEHVYSLLWPVVGSAVRRLRLLPAPPQNSVCPNRSKLGRGAW